VSVHLFYLAHGTPPTTYPIVYAGYLSFQLYSHASLYEDKGDHSIQSTNYTSPKFRFKRVRNNLHLHHRDVESSTPIAASRTGTATSEVFSEGSQVQLHGQLGLTRFDQEHHEQPIEEKEEEEAVPKLSLWMTVALLAIVTVVSFL
jgi:Ca2+:H+ antiporter